ncbi:MAG: energy-coupling factor transporter transmembrane protein EcfT, partial [Anaerolineaceae bacterium]|nr:energy-coupling factor transporter transmembrane protein EcfT [Anaerolineaceae bacterium]
MLKIQYITGTSFLHKLHPATKLLWLIVLSMVMFFFQSTWVNFTILLCLILTMFLVLKNFFRIRGLRLAFLTAFFLFLLQVIFYHDGILIINILGIVNITNRGLNTGILISSRFLIIILT